MSSRSHQSIEVPGADSTPCCRSVLTRKDMDWTRGDFAADVSAADNEKSGVQTPVTRTETYTGSICEYDITCTPPRLRQYYSVGSRIYSETLYSSCSDRNMQQEHWIGA